MNNSKMYIVLVVAGDGLPGGRVRARWRQYGTASDRRVGWAGLAPSVCADEVGVESLLRRPQQTKI